MRKFLAFILTSMLAIAANAMPVRPGSFTVTQSDGTVLTLRMVGDEHFHYYVDVNSGRPMLRAADGNYFVATDAQLSQLKTAAAVRREADNARRMERLPMTTMPQADGRQRVPGVFSGELVGSRRGLVILVNFAGSDNGLPYEMQTTREQWDDAFNKVGYNENGHIGSVHDYFYDQSYGKFDLEFDVVGPVTVSRNVEYYGENNSYGHDGRPASMIVEACKLVDSQVDFSQYDWDGDGEVDQVYVIYAGYGEATSGADPMTIWPHESTLLGSTYRQRLKLDKVYLNTYACSNELCGTSGVKMTGIGTACHEFSHCIGYPDFYDVDYSGAFAMDAMDIMCNGGHSGPTYNCEVPCGYTSYERWMAGWLEPKELKDPCVVTGLKNIGDEPEAYVIYNEGHKAEYFLLENRIPTRWFSYLETHPGHHGMLVLHVDYNSTAWTQNQANDDPKHPRMTIIPGGCSYGTYYDNVKSWKVTKEDFMSMTFPGSKHVTELTNESHYDFGGKLFSRNVGGTYTMNKPITEIEENMSEGTISFVFRGEVESGHRWSVNFETGSGSIGQKVWTQTSDHEKMILPAAEGADAHYKFLGWSTEFVSPTTTRPARLLHAGSAYRPTADVTLYAVYGYSADGHVNDEFRLVSELTDGRNYVFATKGAATTTDVYCITSEGLTAGEFVKGAAGAVVSVDFDAPVPTINNPSDACVWRAAVVDDEVTLSNGANYLVLNSTDGLSLSATPFYIGWLDKYGLYTTKEGSTTKYYLRMTSGAFGFNKTGSTSARMYAYEESDLSDKDVVYTTTDVTGIAGIRTDAASSGAVYNLAGQRIAAPTKGVSIVGGRKVVR